MRNLLYAFPLFGLLNLNTLPFLHGTCFLSIPGRPFCEDKEAIVDLELLVCAKIDKTLRVLPKYATCPEGMVRDKRICVGTLISALEFECPADYFLNREKQCMKAEGYTPPQKFCPEGYTPNRDSESQRLSCVSTRSIAPIKRPCHYEIDTCENTLECPTGYTLVKRWHFKKKRREWTCTFDAVTSPITETRCQSAHSVWSVNINGCISVSSAQPQRQCPKKNGRVGIGQGDWDTPNFKYEEKYQNCVANSAPAIRYQCEPGWALEGLFNPYCYKKIFSPVHYDCAHVTGFILRWVSGTPVCEFDDDSNFLKYFSEGPDYLTSRTKLTGRTILSSSGTAYDVLSGYESGQSTQQFGNPELYKDTITSSIEPLSQPILDYSQFVEQDLKYETNKIYQSAENYHFFSSRPMYREDLLTIRAPGETGAYYKKPSRIKFGWASVNNYP